MLTETYGMNICINNPIINKKEKNQTILNFFSLILCLFFKIVYAFNNVVEPLSYVYAFFASILFAVIVNQVMKGQINKINMAESLKAVE